jgi:hypothetical protein
MDTIGLEGILSFLPCIKDTLHVVVFLAAVFDLPSITVPVPPVAALIGTQSSPKRLLVTAVFPGQTICGNPFHAQIS